jgi:two-component system, NarL family, sensor histidine kinase DesK
MIRELPGLADDAAGLHAFRRLVLTVATVAILLSPLRHLLQKPLTAAGWFQVVGAIVFLGLVLWQIWVMGQTGMSTRRTPWLTLAGIVALAMALFVVGGHNGTWLSALVFAAAVCGRYSSTPAPAAIAGGACGLAGLIVASTQGFVSGETFSAVAFAPLAALFAYTAGRRMDTVDKLRRTRAELARAAVAEERLRIARDLHDLLGHSLSLITLKAELAGRVMKSDPDRAALEISELESVARQSLSDVRGAVAGFRQPDLAGELTAARQLLDAAGITSDISSADTGGLAQNVDSTLAWAVREGATNVVRHSRATKVTIRVSADTAAAAAEIRDNGPAAPEVDDGGPHAPPLTLGPDGRSAAVRQRPAFAGSGLAGLAERVRSLGGEIAAGAVEPQGFLLRVVVPLSPQA